MALPNGISVYFIDWKAVCELVYKLEAQIE